MKTSSETISGARFFVEKKTIEYIANAGFCKWGFTTFHMVDADKVERKLKNCHKSFV